MLLIGSRALSLLDHTLLHRPPKDYDFIATIEEYESFAKKWLEKRPDSSAYPLSANKMVIKSTMVSPIEFEIAWPGSTAESLLKIVNRVCAPDEEEVLGETVILPTLNILYELKYSHRFLKNSPHFLKTMEDLRVLKNAGAFIEHEDWVKAREKETYNYSHPKLNVKKDDFFKGDGIQYVYDHDTIHVAIKRLDKPAYQYFKPEDRDVLCDKNMFFAVDEHTRLCSVVEEATVLALERSQIPYKGKVDPLWSFKTGLMKICTSITSGWFRSFCYDHYNEALAMYDPSYVEKFWEAVEKGIVKKL